MDNGSMEKDSGITWMMLGHISLFDIFNFNDFAMDRSSSSAINGYGSNSDCLAMSLRPSAGPGQITI